VEPPGGLPRTNAAPGFLAGFVFLIATVSSIEAINNSAPLDALPEKLIEEISGNGKLIKGCIDLNSQTGAMTGSKQSTNKRSLIRPVIPLRRRK